VHVSSGRSLIRGQPPTVDDVIIIAKLLSRRVPRPGLKLTLPLAAVIMVAACSNDPAGNSPADPTEPTTPSASEPSARPATPPTTPATPRSAAADGTPVRIILGDTVITGRLSDNPTPRDLATRLPLTLSFRDFNGVEKVAKLPQPLSMEGVPAG
jgi:hypothetical protein